MATSDATAQRLRVTYAAGQATDWNGVAEPLRHGIVRLAAHLFANRDTPEERGPPAVVAALWRPYRQLRLGGGLGGAIVLAGAPWGGSSW